MPRKKKDTPETTPSDPSGSPLAPVLKPKKEKAPKVDAASIIDQEQAERERTREQSRMALGRKVRIFYDLQRLRLQTAGRLVEREDEAKIKLHPADVQVLSLRADELHHAEKRALGDVEKHLSTLAFYRNTLNDKTRFRGIGPTMAGVILSEFDIVREDTPSKMWAFAGLAPVDASRCRHCSVLVDVSDTEEGTFVHAKTAAKKCDRKVLQPEDVFASGKSMRPTRGEKLRYNSFLRSKLVGVLGPVLLKLNNVHYKAIYDGYKKRKQSEGWGTSDGHRHQAAIRYMVKQLLCDIWRDWRSHEGLTVRAPYHEEKLGHVHGEGRGPALRPMVAGPVEPEMSPEAIAELEAMGETGGAASDGAGAEA